MTEAMWRIVIANNPPPGFRKDRGIGPVGSVSGQKYELALAFEAG
jgi:hypothetical protein